MTDAANPTPSSQLIRVGTKTMPRADAERVVRRFAAWFWWVAGLSLMNSIAAAADMNYRMILGLGITQLLDAFFPFGQFVHLLLVLLAVGLFVLFGFYARRLSSSWYLTGMIVYAADALLFIPAGDWIAVGFHVFVLFMLWTGYTALRSIKEAPPEGSPGGAAS